MSEMKVRAKSVVNLASDDLTLTFEWSKGAAVKDIAAKMVNILSVMMDAREFEDMLLDWGKSKREFDVDQAIAKYPPPTQYQPNK